MIELQNICAKFGYKEVLKNINLKFSKGKTYVLLGENGAGKSTLAHIICGDKKATDGKILINDKIVDFKDPKDSLNYKIACLHQRPFLSDSISVKENLYLGTKDSIKSLNKKIPLLLEKWLPGINPKEKVKNLSLSQKFFLSLTGILLKEPETIILDEASALLNNDEKALFYKNLMELKKTDKTFILITHNFEEALHLGDYLILLKDGNILKEGPVKEFSIEKIKKSLFENNKNQEEIKKPEKIPNSSLIQSSSLLHLENYERQIIKFVSKNRNKGFALVASDRNFRASNPNLSILQMTGVYHTKLSKKSLIEFCQNLCKKAEVNIKYNEKVSALSGGMLQRLILSRELECRPKTLILCQPLQGLDSQSSEKLYDLLRNEGKKGCRIIILGSPDFPKELCQNYIFTNTYDIFGQIKLEAL
ncbi:MAG: ATP-binding cassette domain-containing protein [Treponema sp.]|nr:ATP-binding cassette domain-containing protein [Treponema sp.]